MRYKDKFGLAILLSMWIALPVLSQPLKEIPQGQGDVVTEQDKYIIGPEDVLYIHVWKEDALTRQVPVRTDGKISLPLIDEVKAEGLTPLQLKHQLTTLLKKYIDNPTVSVTVVEANSAKVFVTGEVRTPGAVRLRSQTTIVQAIPLAGGFTDKADEQKVAVIRKGDGKDRRFEVNYKDIVAGKALQSNIVLKPGDTIIVPQSYQEVTRDEILKRQPAGDVAADADQYVIGAEDVLFIHVWKEEALTRTVPVRIDGNISLPLVQEVKAAGLTPLQLRELLTTKLKIYIENPIVSVTVTEANSSKVFVTGEVRTPGAVRLRSQTTIVQVIPLAGGFTDQADQKRIAVIRKEDGKDRRFEVNYKDIIAGKALESNILLKPGDAVIVPQESPQVTREEILKRQPAGEVAADSDRYLIGPEDVLFIHVWKEETLTRTVPVRIDGNISLPLVQEVKAAGLTPLQLREILTTKLKIYIENPIVSVTVTEANSYRVFVSGEVRTPGVYRLRSETTLLQIIPMAGGFTEWANQKKIMIIRKEDGKERRITVNYKNAVSGEGGSSNVVLKAGDTIIVP